MDLKNPVLSIHHCPYSVNIALTVINTTFIFFHQKTIFTIGSLFCVLFEKEKNEKKNWQK